MSTDTELHTGEKLKALWDKFAHDVQGGSVSIPFEFGDTSKTGVLHIDGETSESSFKVTFTSEEDGSHFGLFTVKGLPKAEAIYSKGTGHVLVDSKSLCIIFGDVHHEVTLRRNGRDSAVSEEDVDNHMRSFIDKAYQSHIG